MTLAPFHAASPAIQIHILAALVVVALTPLQFAGFRKGSAPHRITGYAWLAAMTVLALASFLIPAEVGPSLAGFGFIHTLSVMALVSVALAIRHARAGAITAHRKTLMWLSIGFFVAGALTFAPGRIMGRMLFG